MIFLSKELKFPNIETASQEGILAIGGDLSPERLQLAYANGIFPWYNEGEPIIWYSPDPRMVLYPEKLKVSKSMRQVLNKDDFQVTFNTNFSNVISKCKNIPRNGQNGTWITNDMIRAYQKLHDLGIARSVEVWKNNKLIGGLYGIDLGHIFCGESMFSLESNASKIAFIYLVKKLQKENYVLIDCQVYNSHLASLGAEEISRSFFKKMLKRK